jgi:hypothetical protein
MELPYGAEEFLKDAAAVDDGPIVASVLDMSTAERCVTFTRHSLSCFIGRTIAPLRGKRMPRFSASSIEAGMVFQASPAACGSTPFSRNIMVG